MSEASLKRAQELVKSKEWLNTDNSDEDAELIAQVLDAWAQEAGREKLAAWMIEHSFATGHGDKFADLLKELSWQVAELRAAEQRGRLEEAKWWSANSRGLMIPEAHQALNKRIAELERAASPAKKAKNV